jgi:hypothetical protein
MGGRLARRWFLAILAALGAAAVGTSVMYHVDSKGLHKKGHFYGVADAQLLVDSFPSSLARLDPNLSSSELAGRAPLYAEYATSAPLVAAISRQAGVSPDSVSITANAVQATAPANTNVASGSTSTTPLTSSSGGSAGSSSIVTGADGVTPVVTIHVQASSAPLARRLAQATIAVLQGSVQNLEKSQKIRKSHEIVLRRLGPTDVGRAFSAPKSSKAIGLGAATFVVLMLVVLMLDNVLEGLRARRGRARPPWYRRVLRRSARTN